MSIQSLDSGLEDPWDWSVDQVVREFCRTDADRPTWCSPTDRLPDPAALEQKLRDNDMTGELVLTEITREVLCTELKIKSMGQRRTIEKCINHLRSISQKFQTFLSEQPLVPPITPVQSWLNSSVQPYLASNIGGSVQSGVPTAQPFDSPRPDTHADVLGGLPRNNPKLRSSIQIFPPRPSPTEVPRVGSPLKTQTDSPHSATNHEAPVTFSQQIQVEKPLKARRRIAPTFVAHIDDRTHRSEPLFGEDDSLADVDEVVEEESGEREFNIVGVHGTDGQRIGASRRIKKYLISVGKDLDEDHELSSELKLGNSNNDVSILKAPEVHQQQKDYDEFDYLLAKYPTKPETEDALALYGESGDEGEFDDETWQEIEQDNAEDTRNGNSGRALSLSEVNSAIDTAILEFKAIWQESKLPKVQAKGFRLWKKANRDGRVEDEIITAQYWIQRLQKSIIKIRQAICRETWSTAAAVRHQCQSLEETIFQQEEHQYNISILGRTTAPPRPERKSIKRDRSKPHDLGEGEILLESESELSLSNFIEDDQVELFPASYRPAASEDIDHLGHSDDSDDVMSPQAKRRQNKAQLGPVDPRNNPFIESSSSSPKSESSRTNSDLDLPAPLPKSQYEDLGHDQTQPIELLSSSDPPTPGKVHTPQNTRATLEKAGNQRSTPIRQTIKPKTLLLDVEEIKKIPWEKIEKDNDHRRALALAIYTMHREKAKRVRDFVKASPRATLQQAVHQGLSAIVNRQADVEGIVQNHVDRARTTALLFASYSLARKIVDEERLNKARMKKAQDLVASGFPGFFDSLSQIFSQYPETPSPKKEKRKHSDVESREDGCDRTSDSDVAVPQRTPGKRRRRHVKQSQTAISSQRAGQQRMQEMKQREASLNPIRGKTPRNRMDSSSYAIGMEDPVIYLDPKIGGKVKPHQIDGIRFMWRELMTDENKQGCLLAHTMGLGKTMQVISLLVTIAQSAKSSDAGIREQIPHDLQDLKVLVLCPPSLIDNWYDEILIWRPSPTVLGDTYKITQKLKRLDRVQEIAQWAHRGGILIISYDMFRGLIVNKAATGKGADERPLSDEDHAAVEENLLKHPNIIIADEAHKMKNKESSISKVASRFQSSRRIALTGSPLANNLDEYFAMIDWIAPGYLGTKEQFSAKYAIPISAGLYNDSDMHDRRTSLRKLHVLKKNLDPKISRADINAIANDLPSKTEFFITIPLTKLQTKAYNLYTKALLGGSDLKTTGNARLWDWLAILSLLCNHPSTFLNKLDDRLYGHANRTKKTKAKPIPTTDDVEDTGFPADIELANAGLSQELIEEQRKIFRGPEDMGMLEEPSQSHRSQIVCDIIEFAVAAGDKVLLFSHSLPTLDYLESTISSMGFSTCRLDGSTNVTKRQEAVKDFNKETSEFNVFLISTRAGGLGLNLQGANRVILFDYGFNPTWEEQAIGRAYRLGQRKPVFVYRLRAGGTFEELIYNKAVFKTQLSARVVDKKNPMRYASKNATDYLFPVKEVPQQDLGELYGKDPLVLDAVLSRSKFIRDIILTETFQKEENESLTAEEEKQANDELKDEQEMRRDPLGWERKRTEHQQALLRIRAPVPSRDLVPSSARPHNFKFKHYGPGVRQTQTSILSPMATNPPPTASPMTMNPTATAPPTASNSEPTASPMTTNESSLAPPKTPTPIIRYISNPNAIRSPQQSEGPLWDHISSPHLQSRSQNVLGINPNRILSHTIHSSPTSQAPPEEVSNAPGSPPNLGKQADGAGDKDSGSDSDITGCKSQ